MRAVPGSNSQGKTPKDGDMVSVEKYYCGSCKLALPVVLHFVKARFHPCMQLDLVKTRQQCGMGLSITGAMMNIVEENGVLGLFAGLVSFHPYGV